MCRLFAQISPTPASASDFLVRKKLSLLRQSHCNPKGLQKDGWGLGYWNAREGGWTLVKSPGAVFRQKTRFRAAAQAARSSFVLAHVRHASNPKKLPKEKILGLENTQPFAYKNLIFAHNGTLNIPDEVARTLGTYRKRLRGHNDSEVLFWLFVKAWN